MLNKYIVKEHPTYIRVQHFFMLRTHLMLCHSFRANEKKYCIFKNHKLTWMSSATQITENRALLQLYCTH